MGEGTDSADIPPFVTWTVKKRDHGDELWKRAVLLHSYERDIKGALRAIKARKNENSTNDPTCIAFLTQVLMEELRSVRKEGPRTRDTCISTLLEVGMCVLSMEHVRFGSSFSMLEGLETTMCGRVRSGSTEAASPVGIADKENELLDVVTRISLAVLSARVNPAEWHLAAYHVAILHGFNGKTPEAPYCNPLMKFHRDICVGSRNGSYVRTSAASSRTTGILKTSKQQQQQPHPKGA